MKKYIFSLTITEGNDEFWESLKNRAGCDDVQEAVREALQANGFLLDEDDDGENLKLVRYEG